MRTCPNENFRPETDAEFLGAVVTKLCSTYQDKQGINHIEGFNLPGKKEVVTILNDLLELLFPGFTEKKMPNLDCAAYMVGDILSRVYYDLTSQVASSLRYNCETLDCKNCDVPAMSQAATRRLIASLPGIRETMKIDVQAAYDGDPAAKSFEEIVLSYPGVQAIAIQRIAHELYLQNVPLIPRIMSEHAHSITGIDIHPGAKLGKGLFIDHGTGVVIGETAELGHGVKIYQGVTLGALSFPKDASGQIIKGQKRHPSIGDGVTIYAGATILGDVHIGEGSVIGGNVWFTESCAPHTMVTIPKPELTIRSKHKPHPEDAK